MRKVNEYSDMNGFEDVKETIEVLDFGFKLTQAVTDSLSDGKINLLDFPKVLSPLMAASAAVDGFANVKSELTNMTSFGKQVVEQFVTDRFDISNDEVEILVEQTINAVIGIVSLGFQWSEHRHKAS